MNKLVVKNADMSPDLQASALAATEDAFNQFSKESAIAASIREFLDKKAGGTWNVVVGKNFGSGVTHESKRYLNLTKGQLSILIWKSG